MDYEVYKVLHILTILLFFTSSAVTYSHSVKVKWASVIAGISSLLILISGMGLIARIGISHGEGWPIWIKVKIAIWLLVAMGSPMIAKRFVSFKKYAYAILMALAFIAIYSAVYKYGA